MLTPLFVLLFAAPPAAPDVSEGRALFNDPGLGKNGVSCAMCHAVVENEAKDGDGLVRSGHTLFNVAKRKFWRGDAKHTAHPTLADAVDVCVQLFHGGAPLEGKQRVALDGYLKSLSKKDEDPALVLEPALEADLDYAREKYKGGDADAGRALFFRACSVCHPKGGEGIGPSLKRRTFADVARKVREGNGLMRGSRKGTDWMPFYGRDRLSDKQIADLGAFVATLER